MNTSYFLSKRIRQAPGNTFSSTIHKIAIGSIAVGLGVMMVSFLILAGFQTTIKEKIYSFGGHLQVSKYTLENSYEESPVTLQSAIYQKVDSFDYVRHVQPYSYKPGLLKTEEEVQGVVLKGVNKDFDLDQFGENIIEGEFITFGGNGGSKEILISRKIANKLELKVGDKVIMYFIQVPQRYRRLTVKGIYNTGLEEFDDQVIIGDLALIQRLNGWDSTQVGGFEVYLNDINQLNAAKEYLYEELDTDLYVEKITDRHLQIFEWLGLLDKNVIIFLALILFVACFNMISILLIMIMERTQMVGLLKAFGATNRQIRNVFIYNGMYLIAKGMILGNVIGIGFGLLQQHLKLIPLDAENYYMDYVPVEWNPLALVFVNILTFIVVSLVLLVPTGIIARVKPIKAIRFD